MSDARVRSLSTAGGLFALVLWSATFALARSVSEQVGALTAGAAVYLFGGLLCLVRLARSPSPVRRLLELSPRYVWGCGFLFVLYTALVYVAVGLARDREQLLELALINYLWPAATILLSIPLLGARASGWLAPGTLLALTGEFLVLTQGTRLSWGSFREHVQGNPVAYLLMLLAAVAWALYSNLARRWAKPDQGGAVEWFVPATGLVLLGLRFLSPEPAAWNTRVIAEAGALGLLTTLAYALWDVAMRRGNLFLVAACSYLTPLLSTLVSCAYLQVMPGRRLWAGCALIVLGSLISWRSVADSGSAKT